MIRQQHDTLNDLRVAARILLFSNFMSRALQAVRGINIY
jgi:hypothetical protein